MLIRKGVVSQCGIYGLVLLFVADAALASFRFGVMADSQGSSYDPGVNPILSRLITDMNAHNPALCLFPGDLVYGFAPCDDNLESQLRVWLDRTSHFTGRMYVTPGNHDLRWQANKYNVGNLAIWREMFPDMPQNGPDGEKGVSYYFDYGNSRFISINSDWPTWPPTVYVNDTWLNEILEASAEFEHVFVTSHHPGLAGEFGTLVSHGVDAFFCGHQHSYVVSQPSGSGTTWQAIVGTAGPGSPNGYLIVEVDGPHVEATFYADLDYDGHYDDVYDSFTIAAPEPGTMALLVFGAVGVLSRRRRKRRTSGR